MLFVLRALSSFFSPILRGRSPGARARVPASASPRESSHRIAVVAMVANGEDRQVLMDVSAQQGLQVHFVESPEEALKAIERLRAPAALVDRNWPGSDWRTVVEGLSSSEVRPCVILMSGVLDERLWAEVVGRGGYEVLAKPVQAEQAVRVIRLALSYQQAASRTLLRVRA
jgi:DNA-binding NtrC family response regulator